MALGAAASPPLSGQPRPRRGFHGPLCFAVRHPGFRRYSCGSARYSVINQAIAATRPGGTVVVCRGIYHTQVIVAKPLSLIGRRGAVIDARGKKPLTIGPTTLPGSIGIGVLAPATCG